MANLNKVMLIGNLTRDPELRYTPKGTAVTDLALAINRVWSNDQGQKQEETTFVDVTFWGRQAEIAQQYLAKGRGVYIEGRLQMDTWDDKETGKKRSRLKIHGENLQFLPDGRSTPGGNGNGATGGNSGGGFSSRPPQQSSSRSEPSHGGSPASSESYQDEDDIPF
jgi:single-strand DNA-binding protein